MAERGSIFREEAIAAHAQAEAEGGLLQLTPRWLAWSYRLLVTTLACALLFLCVAQVGEYAVGVAVIRASGHRALSAPQAGTVIEVVARPGQRVHAGDLLLRLHDDAEQLELRQSERAFELALTELLRSPGDPAIRRGLAELRSRRDRARALMEARELRSPEDAAVSDVFVRAGQRLEAGEPALALVEPGGGISVAVALPGRHRPQLTSGMTLHLIMDGYPERPLRATLSWVGEEVVGAAAASRHLGVDPRDGLRLDGPWLLAEAELSGPAVDGDDEPVTWFHGMQGEAEVRVRSRSLAVTLVPGLERLLRRSRVD